MSIMMMITIITYLLVFFAPQGGIGPERGPDDRGVDPGQAEDRGPHQPDTRAELHPASPS